LRYHCLGIISAVLTGLARYFSAIAATKALYFIRKDIYDSINRQSYSFFDKRETGDLVSRATSDIETMNPLFTQGIQYFFQSGITVIIVLIAVQLMSTQLIWILWVSIPIYLFFMIWVALRMRSIYLTSRQAFGSLTTSIRENILGAQVVRIFNSMTKEVNKFSKKNKEFRQLTLKTVSPSSLLTQLGIFYLGLLSVAAFYIGGTLVLDHNIDIGTLVAFGGYLALLTAPFSFLANTLVTYVQAYAAMSRVNDLFESIPEVIERSNAISAENIAGNVAFENVSFGYNSRVLILQDINFRVNIGEKLAILGITGSGKSTLISLLPRFYEISHGKITIDDIDIKDFKLEELRRQIGLVSQNIFLFNTSVFNNIAYGKENATLEAVQNAAKMANIHDFIMTLPDQYDTIVGERAMQLSGGQKQRIAIARALLIQPKILILDDSTSSVDVDTEYKIQQALELLMKNKTTLIITQRVSTIRNADKILVLDKGRIVGYGTHEELYQQNAIYTQIYSTLYQKQKIVDNSVESTLDLSKEN
jgi:ATP-binding cassette subfamily B protein